jgi:hypothetical protein
MVSPRKTGHVEHDQRPCPHYVALWSQSTIVADHLQELDALMAMGDGLPWWSGPVSATWSASEIYVEPVLARARAGGATSVDAREPVKDRT